MMDERVSVDRLALYTTVYPAVKPFLPAWYRSVVAQTDGGFDLWIGVDAMDTGTVVRAVGESISATWVHSQPGDTPAQLRQRALADIAARYDGVVLVDSDDVLHPSRMAVARAALRMADGAGCSLRLIDTEGRELGPVLTLPAGLVPEDVLPRHNIFGLSNTALRADLLRKCLPIPSAVEVLDWFMFTRAWLQGARLAFSDAVCMYYRQHTFNMVRVSPPFSEQQVARDTDRALAHFRLVTATIPDGADPERVSRLGQVKDDVEQFFEHVTKRPSKLTAYVKALNGLDLQPLWWSCVAHPALSSMWS